MLHYGDYAYARACNAFALALNARLHPRACLVAGGELREHQMAGLRWMVGLCRSGLNGILADEMGLGGLAIDMIG